MAICERGGIVQYMALELELIELIDQYRKLGFSDRYILKNIKKVWDDMREPQPELKGELDT